jgi:hypothetical protein
MSLRGTAGAEAISTGNPQSQAPNLKQKSKIKGQKPK